MGTENLFACHLPMFFTPEHSYQAILEIELEGTAMETYLRTRKENPGKPLIIMNSRSKPMLLKDLVNSTSFPASEFIANDNGDPAEELVKSTTATVKRSLLFEKLDPRQEYPEKLSYYLYGTNSEFHLSHLLTKAPNFEQEVDITLSGDILNKTKRTDFEIVKVSIPSLNERSNQPITMDPLTKSEYSIRMDDGSTGNISIGNKFWINNTSLNSGSPGMDMPGMNM
jgi:hypothetical protein